MAADLRRLFRFERVTVRTLWGDRAVAGWRHGEFAVHECLDWPGRFVITLLPLGLCFGPGWCMFDRATQAMRCALQFQRCRNDWARIEQASLTAALRTQLKSIAGRCGALAQAPTAFTASADTTALGRALGERPNGYGITP